MTTAEQTPGVATTVRPHLTPSEVTALQRAGLPIVVADIDGVTLDNAHRLHHIVETVEGKQVQKQEPDWVAFHAAGHMDAAAAAVPLLASLSRTHSIVFVTARVAFKDQRQHLTDKLYALMYAAGYDAAGCMYPHVYLSMREPEYDWEALQASGKPKPTNEGDTVDRHAEHKRQVIRWMREHGLNPTTGLDDSLAICKMFAEEGLLSLRVHNHIDDSALWR